MIGTAFSLVGLVVTLTLQALVISARLVAWMIKLLVELVELTVHAMSRPGVRGRPGTTRSKQ